MALLEIASRWRFLFPSDLEVSRTQPLVRTSTTPHASAPAARQDLHKRPDKLARKRSAAVFLGSLVRYHWCEHADLDVILFCQYYPTIVFQRGEHQVHLRCTGLGSHTVCPFVAQHHVPKSHWKCRQDVQSLLSKIKSLSLSLSPRP